MENKKTKKDGLAKLVTSALVGVALTSLVSGCTIVVRPLNTAASYPAVYEPAPIIKSYTIVRHYELIYGGNAQRHHEEYGPLRRNIHHR